MFNNLYQVEQAGRNHQQVLWDIQSMAEQANVAHAAASAPRRTWLPTMAQPIRMLIGRARHPRTTASWLMRVFALVAVVSLFSTVRPAAAATSTGSTAAGAHGVVDPAAGGAQRAVTDPFNGTSFSPVQDPATVTSTRAVHDPGTPGGHSTAIDPFNGGSVSPVQDPAIVTSPTAAIATEPMASPVAYLTWLLLLVVSVALLVVRQRQHEPVA